MGEKLKRPEYVWTTGNGEYVEEIFYYRAVVGHEYFGGARWRDTLYTVAEFTGGII